MDFKVAGDESGITAFQVGGWAAGEVGAGTCLGRCLCCCAAPAVHHAGRATNDQTNQRKKTFIKVEAPEA